ncbi:hypothetical protein FDF74_08025 [Clostridium niameyense]|uniref:ABC transporter permease n=1 Tax=Clostridium niameyense TaxID=1622073 RepID=A0A6M0RA53_9CLOT|nr:ABC transporter permease subunit [Clostridium niameyense]NEZ47155.1 hypothetical protein [Clostridium niameyense]
MMNLIKAELFKVKKEKNLLFMVLGLIGILSLALFKLNNQTTVIGIRNILNTNSVNFSVGSNILIEILKSADILVLIFLPIIISTFMTDFSIGTVKNNVISGYSRSKIYISKLIVSSMICIFLVLVYSLVSFLILTLINGYDGNLTIKLILNTIKVISIQTPLYIAIISTTFMVGSITRSKSIVISIYLLYQVLVCMIVHLFQNLSLNIIRYEPISNLDKAAHIGTNTFSNNITFILMGLIIIIISSTIGILRINKMDIK